MPENAPGLKFSCDATSAAILVITGTAEDKILQAFPIFFFFFAAGWASLNLQLSAGAVGSWSLIRSSLFM